jgi:hypothetical protein
MTTTITGATGIDNIKAATGAVLQVVSVNKSDTWTYSGSTTFQDITGLAATITPTSSSSKILVQVNINISGTERYHGARLLRGSTLIGEGDTSSNRSSVSISSGSNQDEPTNLYVMRNSSFSFLDSPSTTSATTYKVQAVSTQTTGATTYVNRAPTDGDASWAHRGSSTITLTEIAG